LLFAALGRASAAVWVEQAAVLRAEIGVLDGSVFERLGTKTAAFEDAAAAHELSAESRVQPGRRSEIKSITKDEALERGLTDIGHEESRLPDFVARGDGGVGKPNQGHAEKPEVGVDERGGFVEANTRVRGVKLPLRPRRIADSDPRAADQINVARKALDFAGFEIERILGNKNRGIGLTFDFHGPTNIVKKAVAGADVVVRFVGFEMFVVVVQQDVASGDGFVVSIVVFDVVGPETRASIVNVHVAVSGGDFALAGLCFRFEVGDAAFAGRRPSLLTGSEMRGYAGQHKEKRRQTQTSAKRGANPCPRMRIYAKHAVNGNSWIA
jgi:hypothetical protein